LRRRDARSRSAREITYRELAARTGWSHAVIGEYFTGRTLPPTDRFDVLVRLLGAAPAEQSALASMRDVAEEGQRTSAARPAGGVRLGGAVLVGRRAELATLRAAVDATRDGQGGAVFVVGEAGIGKSRLAAEAGRYAEAAGMRVLRGRSSRGAMQFRPLAEALLSLLRWSGPPDDPDLVPYLPALSMLVPGWGPPRPAAGADHSPAILAEGVLRLAVSAGRPSGSLLVLEDLHDADPEAFAVIDYLVDNAAREPLLVLGTARAEPGAALELIRDAHRRRAAAIVQPLRLDDKEVRQLAASCLDAPAGQVPEPVVDRLSAVADGIPLHVEELLAAMAGDGTLVRSGGQWTVAGPIGSGVPGPLAGTLMARVDRLDEPTRAVLAAAALLGREFPAEVAGAAAGVGERQLPSCLRAAVDAQLVVASGDLFAFRHALTAEALRDRLLPGERAELCRRAAGALEGSLVPGWERLAAELWTVAGERIQAAKMFGVAGRRATAQGAVATAVSLLESGLRDLAGDTGAAAVVADLSEALIDAYADAGRLSEAYQLAQRVDSGLAAPARAEMHLRLARAAAAVGHWADGLRELNTAQRALAARSTNPHTNSRTPVAEATAHSPGDRRGRAMAARIDAVAARLAFGNPASNRLRAARTLAMRSLGAAEATGQPDVACDALDTLGRCLRLHNLDRADSVYRRGLATAGQHQLVNLQIRFLYQLGAHDGIREADPGRLREALALAHQAGAVVSALTIQIDLGLVLLCRAEFQPAEQMLGQCGETAERLGLHHLRLIALGVQACVAAHRARPAELEALLAKYRAMGGEDNDFTSVVRGFGLGIGRLLQEDPQGAAIELDWAMAAESARPVPFLSYVPGPHLLLSVLDGRAGTKQCRALARSAQAQAGWNRLFLVLSRAVLHGRAGDRSAARRMFAEFLTSAGPYPLARHLGLRLVASCALADGWGDPVRWLRAAEAYFRLDAPEVARGCRRLLREAGAAVPQHRVGSEEIPPVLRERGVTVREYEVLRLVAQRLTNQEIGRRLFLSPRTVEKHVARLLVKTGAPDRKGLVANLGSRGENIRAAVGGDAGSGPE
jgi:DNA-binding CsgD family transcriptional regulator